MARHRLLVFAVSSIFAALFAGCGGGSSNQTAGPASGSFTNANLNGSYTFTTSGTNTNGSTSDFFSLAGSFQANGSGTITGGTIDVDSPATSTLLTNSAITGTYSVGSDGRGSATINSSAGSFHLAFVLISNSHGLVTRYDNNATASGSIDLQSSSAFSLASLAGTYAFTLSGIDGGSNSEVSAGVVTTDASGNVTGGIEDINDFGSVSNPAINAAAGAVTAPNATSGRGTIAIAGNIFAYYVISASHLKLVEIDNVALLAGDAYPQTSTAIAAGAYVFTDGGNTASGPYTAAGLLSVDGAGNIQSGSIEDVNSAGVLSQSVAITGTYAVAGNGRGTATINGNLGTSNFAIYPSTGGIQLVETDTTAVTGGVATAQVGSGFSTSTINGIYGMNFDGANTGGEVDLTAQFTGNGSNGTLTGALDLNNGGVLSGNLALSGPYTMASNGRGTATLTTSAGVLDLVLYAVSGSNIRFVELDNNQVGLGSFQLQQ